MGTVDSLHFVCTLGVPDHPVGPLLEFIKRPDYKAIRETLCGPDSMAK